MPKRLHFRSPIFTLLSELLHSSPPNGATLTLLGISGDPTMDGGQRRMSIDNEKVQDPGAGKPQEEVNLTTSLSRDGNWVERVTGSFS
ncbi:hypothetical protein H5410_017081 [Solanum commersonii]|uniref:Uncharacterized protein n=1 Tax=Solanum commersonii TaxID=4109 RepID=A0A9J5ZYA7_SOLCO|nr:hypothetical protein H5410_017081 [Solanum commersonii]